MLLRFSVANFLSFRESAGISMVASAERIHPGHTVDGPSPSLPRVVRAAALYGANAAGKSNLVQALTVLKSLVVEGVDTGAAMPVERFRLDPELSDKPSEFEIAFYVGDRLYEYFLAVTPAEVRAERLTWIRPTKDEVLFERRAGTAEHDINIGSRLAGRLKSDRQFLEFVARGTRPNQPFLAEAVSRNVEALKPIVEWFRTSLQVITPDAPYGFLEVRMGQDRSFREFIRDFVRTADTGITDIETHDQALDSVVDFPSSLIDMARERVSDNSFIIAGDESGRRITVRRKGDEFFATRITTLRRLTCGSRGTTEFELNEESDGTRRLFDLAPLLYQSIVETEPRVFVIDEIGRSLHPHLVTLLFRAHLAAAGGASQLIATTHESNLLDLELLRRDEIWFVEKNENQASQMYSLHDFQPRYDKDVRTDYLVGRYGAVPFIGDPGRLVEAGSQ